MSASLTRIALILAAASFGAASPAFADDKPAQWWIEIVRERPLPTAVAKERAEAEKLRLEEKAAEKKAEEAKAAAEKEEAAAEVADDPAEEDAGDPPAAKPPVKERVKAMLEKLPALPDAAAEDAEIEEAAEAKDAEAEATEPTDEPDAADPDAAAEEEAPADEAEDAPPKEPDTLLLTVAMAGEIVALDQKRLVFRPTYNPAKELTFPIKEVTSVSRYAPGAKPEAKDPPELEFRVVLRDGSEIPGELVALTEEAITVALVGSGAEIDLPIGQVTRVERNEPASEAVDSPLLFAPDRHVAALSTGEVITGQLLPSRDSDKWLRLASPILTAEAPLSLIDLLVFPVPKPVPNAAEIELAEEIPNDAPVGNNGAPPNGPAPVGLEDLPELEPDSSEVHHLVSLTPAGMLWASNIRLEGDRLKISALGEDGFTVPVERVESVSFGHEGLGSTAPILVWGGYSDEDDEYKKTLDALGERIPSRKLLQSMSKMPDADFMRLLRRSRVLLVPEMESFRKDQLEEAAGKAGRGVPSWGDAFKGFLRRGGNIVFLSPTGDALTFFNDSGLGPLNSGGSGDSWKLTDTGRKLGAKINGTVENVNATHYYRKSADWESWGEAADGNDGVTLVGRRLERGWVMAFGADFYETNDEVTETLVRLLEFRGRR